MELEPLKDISKTTKETFKLVDERPGTITLMCPSQEMIRLEDSGDIYVKGKLVENDKEVVEGMRELLMGHGIYKWEKK